MSILQKKIADIPEPGNYDKSNTKDDAEACGLDTVSFKVRNKDMFVNLMIDKKDNKSKTGSKKQRLNVYD